MAAVIEVDDLTKRYGTSRGIEGLTFQVEQGEVFGFLGPNGAGKTTTIRTLLDLLRPSSGTARLFGEDSITSAVDIRRRIGYLPGEFTLFPKLTGREALQYSANMRGGVAWDEVESLAQRFDCDLDRPICKLSQGNKKKVGLIAAFMHRPELVILDEPTNGLDPLAQQEFMNLVRETAARGATVFLSSHVMPEVERTCDRVAIIRAGRLVAVEQVAALKTRATRRVDIHYAQPPPPGKPEVPGVAEVARVDALVSYDVRGAAGPLIEAAVQLGGILDINTHEPSLEDIFLSYYDHDASEVGA